MVAPPPTPPTVKPTRPGHGEGPGFSGAMKSFALAGVMPRAPNVESLSVSVNEEPRFSDPQHIRQFDADTDVLASLCDQSPAIIALISIETGKVVYMNRAGMTAVGLTSPKDVRDVSPAAYLSPVTYQAMSTVGLQAALSGEEWIDEGTFLNLVTHTEFDVEIRLFPIIERSSNEIHFLATIARDIAARKQATAQLELSESRFRRLAENIPDIVFRARLTDPPQLEYLNTAVESVLGHTVQDCYDNPKIVFSVIGLDLLEASAP